MKKKINKINMLEQEQAQDMDGDSMSVYKLGGSLKLRKKKKARKMVSQLFMKKHRTSRGRQQRMTELSGSCV